MKEITNMGLGPIQLMLRSRKKVNGFGLTVLPGRGKGKNKLVVQDEEITEQINNLSNMKYLTIKDLNN